jgi:hypothetical protein
LSNRKHTVDPSNVFLNRKRSTAGTSPHVPQPVPEAEARSAERHGRILWSSLARSGAPQMSAKILITDHRVDREKQVQREMKQEYLEQGYGSVVEDPDETIDKMTRRP